MSCRLIALLLCGSLLVTGNSDVLKNHLDDVTRLLGKSSNKCGKDFVSYACGSYGKPEAIAYPNEQVHFSIIAQELESNSKFSYASSLKAKDFYYSCKNHQHPEDILKKVALFQKSDFKVSQFLGELKTDGVDFILKTNINLDNGKPKLSIGLQMDIFKNAVYSEGNLKSGLGLLKVSNDEKAIILKEITHFISSGKAIANSRSGSASSDIHDLKSFEGDLYLNELKRLPKLSRGSIEVSIENSENVNNILELLAQMDKKAFKYFAALEILKLFSDFNCDFAVEYFKLPIMAEFHKLYFPKEDKDNHLQILQNFISSAETINRNSPAIERAKEKKRTIENLDKILAGSRIDGDYKDCQISRDNFFQNIINANKYKVYRFLNTEEKDSIAEEVLLNVLNPTNRNKPVSYHYATQGLFLWETFFRENSPKSGCNPDHEFNEYSQALKMSFLDFKKARADNAQTYKDHGISPEETYFLNVAQKQCSRKGNVLWKVLTSSEELAGALGCSEIPACK
ncbi:hypothetical protein ACFFRR_010498 [Megaselia abdita]